CLVDSCGPSREADASADLLGLGGDVDACDPCDAVVGGKEGREDRDGCGLAGAVRAERAEDLPRSTSRSSPPRTRVLPKALLVQPGLLALPSSHSVSDSSRWDPLEPTCLGSILGPFLMTCASAMPCPRPSPDSVLGHPRVSPALAARAAGPPRFEAR